MVFHLAPEHVAIERRQDLVQQARHRAADQIGRKRVILAGCLIAAVSYFPIYNLMTQFAHPQGVFDPKLGKYAIDGVATVAQPEIVPLIALVWVQVIFVTMVYGPIAAFLVEFFPARIRYTSLSIPYHIGNGWFGGFLPLISASLLAATGNIYAGLIYPIVVALMTVVVGGLFIRESRHVKIWDEVGGHEEEPEYDAVRPGAAGAT